MCICLHVSELMAAMMWVKERRGKIFLLSGTCYFLRVLQSDSDWIKGILQTLKKKVSEIT
jgi:hypothetical protein